MKAIIFYVHDLMSVSAWGAAIAQWIRLRPQVRIPSSQSKLLPFKVKFVLYLSREKNENKQKEAGFGPFLKISQPAYWIRASV